MPILLRIKKHFLELRECEDRNPCTNTSRTVQQEHVSCTTEFVLKCKLRKEAPSHHPLRLLGWIPSVRFLCCFRNMPVSHAHSKTGVLLTDVALPTTCKLADWKRRERKKEKSRKRRHTQQLKAGPAYCHDLILTLRWTAVLFHSLLNFSVSLFLHLETEEKNAFCLVLRGMYQGLKREQHKQNHIRDWCFWQWAGKRVPLRQQRSACWGFLFVWWTLFPVNSTQLTCGIFVSWLIIDPVGQSSHG